MSRHEIEIEGLPEGYEPIGAKVGCPSTAGGDLHVNALIFIKRKVRKYDHSKTLDDVLVILKDATGYHPHREAARCRRFMCLPSIWQPNIHGKCPVDPWSCIVNIKMANGGECTMRAGSVLWGYDRGEFLVVSWQFVKLESDVEW